MLIEVSPSIVHDSMSVESLLKEAGQKLTHAKSVSIFSHVRPDGDAYGSALALALCLEKLGIPSKVFNEDGLAAMYSFLPGCKLITKTPASAPADSLIVSLDTSTEPRLGSTFATWGRKVDINLDHHVSNTSYGLLNVIDDSMPATAAIIQNLIELCEWPLDQDIASNLFVGLSTDTGSFRYRGTTSHTFQQASRLVQAGADCAELSKECYQSMSPERFNLLRRAYQSLQVECDNRFAYYVLEPSMFSETGAKSEDTEGIVETSLSVSSIQLGALFEFRDPDLLKISLRSKGTINVSNIAKEFGGGGHPGAAGINFSSDARSNMQKVLDRLRTELK